MKNKFIKSTIILMIGSLLTKLLGFIIKIIFTRNVNIDAINLYSIVMPTYSLLITLANLGLSLVLFSIIPTTLIINIILISLIFLVAPFISNTLLNNKDTYYPIISIAFVIPFISFRCFIDKSKIALRTYRSKCPVD